MIQKTYYELTSIVVLCWLDEPLWIYIFVQSGLQSFVCLNSSFSCIYELFNQLVFYGFNYLYIYVFIVTSVLLCHIDLY